MKNDIEIRQATIADLNAIEKIGDALFDNPIKRDRAIEFLNDYRHHLVLAFDMENVVGMASGFHYVHLDKDPSLFIDEAGVIETHQNKGIGRRLIQSLYGHGKKIGCKEAWVLVDESNKAAKKMYKAAGGTKGNEPICLFDFNY